MRVTMLALAAATLALAGAQARAQDLQSGIGTCAALTDDQARLACYDKLAAQLKQAAPAAMAEAPAASPPSAPAAQVAAAPPPKKEGSWYNPGSWFGSSTPAPAAPQIGTPADFGAESIKRPDPAPGEPPRPEPLQQIQGKAVSVAFTMSGKFLVTLDNGQIWQQIEGDSATARTKLFEGDSVTISRGFLNSYNFAVDGHAGLYKVRRLR